MSLQVFKQSSPVVFSASLFFAVNNTGSLFLLSSAHAADVTISTNTNQTVVLTTGQTSPPTAEVLPGVALTASPNSSAIIAQTAPWAVTNGGNVSASVGGVGAIELAVGGSILNSQSGTISNSIGLGAIVRGGNGTITNRGTISSVRSAATVGTGQGTSHNGTVINEASGRLTSRDATGILYQDSGTINITNAGVAEGGRQGVLMWTGTLDNSGTIRSTNTTTFSDAITVPQGVATINNSGRITGSSFYSATGAGAVGVGSVGIKVEAPGRIVLTNVAGGEITSTLNGIYVLTANGSAITNSGTIQNTSAGTTIFFEGGSGTVTNNAGGTIAAPTAAPAEFAALSGAVAMTGANGVVTNNGTIRGYVLLASAGTIANNVGGRVEGNAAIFNSTTTNVLTTNQGFSGTLTNGGVITGSAAATSLANTGTINGNVTGSTVTNAGLVGGNVTLTADNDSLTLRTGSSIAGTVTGGAGNDTLVLEGSGSANNAFLDFESLSMRGTQWTLSGTSTFGSVTVQSGMLNVSGALTSTGLIALNAAGAGLGGAGNVGGTVNNAAGSISPGNSGAIGSLAISGNYTHGSGARLIIDANELGAGDRLTVGGQAVLQGGTLQIAAVDGAWSTARTYTVLSAAGGVTGQFSSLDLNLAYLTPQLSYTANAVTLSLQRATAEIQKDIVAETTEQQISTATRKTTTAVESRIDEVITAAFPMTVPDGEQQSRLPGALVPGITGLAAGDDMGGWGGWVTLTPTFVEQELLLPGEATPQDVNGRTWDMFAGADRLLGERAVIGALVGFETSDYDLKGSSGERKAEGPMVATYAGAVLTGWLYATAQLNHVWFDNTLAEAAFGSAPVTGKFDSKRLTASVSATARRETENFRLTGKLGYSHTKESFESYRASDGNLVTPDRSRLGRVTVGTEASYRGEVLTPYVLASFERDVEVSGVAGEREGFVLGAGARVVSGRWSVDIYGNTETGRARESAVSLGLNARLTF